MKIKTFKIQNAEGKFSTGGCTPSWTNRGKTWSQINHVKSHLTLSWIRRPRSYYESGFKKDYDIYVNEIPSDWIVIEVTTDTETLEASVSKYPARSLFPEKMDRKKNPI